jgi:hypothetical protein
MCFIYLTEISLFIVNPLRIDIAYRPGSLRSPDEAQIRTLSFAATYEQTFLPPHYFGLGDVASVYKIIVSPPRRFYDRL